MYLVSIPPIPLQFGGKLVCFQHDKPAHPQQASAKTVHISQVVTETDLVARSNQLQQALSNNQFAEFCNMKVANSNSDVEETIWNFLKVSSDLLLNSG